MAVPQSFGLASSEKYLWCTWAFFLGFKVLSSSDVLHLT